MIKVIAISLIVYGVFLFFATVLMEVPKDATTAVVNTLFVCFFVFSGFYLLMGVK